jgi:hypothetical protein
VVAVSVALVRNLSAQVVLAQQVLFPELALAAKDAEERINPLKKTSPLVVALVGCLGAVVNRKNKKTIGVAPVHGVRRPVRRNQKNPRLVVDVLAYSDEVDNRKNKRTIRVVPVHGVRRPVRRNQKNLLLAVDVLAYSDAADKRKRKRMIRVAPVLGVRWLVRLNQKNPRLVAHVLAYWADVVDKRKRKRMIEAGPPSGVPPQQPVAFPIHHLVGHALDLAAAPVKALVPADLEQHLRQAVRPAQ